MGGKITIFGNITKNGYIYIAILVTLPKIDTLLNDHSVPDLHGSSGWATVCCAKLNVGKKMPPTDNSVNSNQSGGISGQIFVGTNLRPL